MKGIILDGYGTLVSIGKKAHPYRFIGGNSQESRQAFYEFVMTNDLPHAQLLQNFKVEDEPAADSIRRMGLEVASIVAFDESRAFLQCLDERGIPWRILSNLATPYCAPLVQALGIAEDKCIFSCRIGMIKPGSPSFQAAAQSMQLAPAQIMMIGDSKKDDVAGSQLAGMTPYHLRRPEFDLWDALRVFDTTCPI